MLPIRLRDHNPDLDLVLFHRLNSDLASMRLVGMTPCLNFGQSLARMKSHINTNIEGATLYKVVCNSETGVFLGEIGLKNISDKHKRAELSLHLLPEYKNEQFYRNVISAFCTVLIKESSINRIQTFVNPNDAIAISSYDQCGFFHEGIMRDYVCCRDEYLDMSILSITRDLYQIKHDYPLFDVCDSFRYGQLFSDEEHFTFCDSKDTTSFTFFPIIESERLILREHHDEDKDSYYRMMSNPDVVRYYGRPPMIRRDCVERDYMRMRALHNIGDTTRFAIILKKTGEYLGTVGVHYFVFSKRGTLSCIIDRPYWRMGFATEALQLLMNYLFDKKSLHRLQVLVDPNNNQAIHFFKKNGFVTEAKLRQYENENGEFIDLDLMSNLSRS